MLHLEVAENSIDPGDYFALVGTVLVVASGVVIAAMQHRADDLKKAERLTGVIKEMTPSNERQLLEELRDDHILSWALREAAPPERSLRAYSSLMVFYAVLLFVLWGFLEILLYTQWVDTLFFTIPAWVPWIFYGLGAGCFIGAAVIMTRREKHRREWTSDLRSSRAIRTPAHVGIALQLLPPTERQKAERRRGVLPTAAEPIQSDTGVDGPDPVASGGVADS